MNDFAWVCSLFFAIAAGYWWGYRDRESWKDKEIEQLRGTIERLLRHNRPSFIIPPEVKTNAFEDEFKKNQQPTDGQKRGT